jgi:hypothetical protein
MKAKSAAHRAALALAVLALAWSLSTSAADLAVSDTFIDSFASGTVSLTVDGTTVATTDVSDGTDFNFTVAANGVFGTKPGIYRATYARGHWGLVGPLSPGPHVVQVLAQGPLFGLAVAYDLTVVAPTN